MVALILVAHSPELARGLRAMIGQSSPAVPVAIAAGTSTGTLGTSSPVVARAIRAALGASGGDGVVVLVDLGSAAMSLEVALEELSSAERELVRVSSGPIVEGAILAGVEAAAGAGLAAVADAANWAASAPKLPPGGLDVRQPPADDSPAER